MSPRFLVVLVLVCAFAMSDACRMCNKFFQGLKSETVCLTGTAYPAVDRTKAIAACARHSSHICSLKELLDMFERGYRCNKYGMISEKGRHAKAYPCSIRDVRANRCVLKTGSYSYSGMDWGYVLAENNPDSKSFAYCCK